MSVLINIKKLLISGKKMLISAELKGTQALDILLAIDIGTACCKIQCTFRSKYLGRCSVKNLF